jgi:adenylylsulfate kinase
MIVLVIGLPGSGKTALAEQLSKRTNSVHLNGDDVRSELSSDLGFSHEDRLEQARRIGSMARILARQGFDVVVDFVCPTNETRLSFGHADHILWVDRIDKSKYEDTNSMWENPSSYTLRIKHGLSIEDEVHASISACGMFDWRKPTTLMLGRYQPWHDGHDALLQESQKNGGQHVLAVRDTYKTSIKDPFDYEFVKSKILESRPEAFIIKMPNITKIVYGRDVGYSIEKISLDEKTESISATDKRKEMGII